MGYKKYWHQGNWDLRCEAVVTLRDGSEATCMRYRRDGSRYCTQHGRKLALAAATASEVKLVDWFRETYRARTKAIDDGAAVVDWAHPDYRVSWTEIYTKAQELGVERVSDAVGIRLWWNEICPNVAT